ncbi:MAG: DNA polymerase III subunit gamma/tau [Acidobacteria bacterium]|nr:DNA polymerase III subunit gamma/tau [Acidobacteriota bacterium]
MAYQVLARKYRPLQFSDVAGQDHVTRTLKNALEQGRIAHGYIFSGHRGIGKTTIARILASALNCHFPIGSPERPTTEPCLKCDSCIEIRQGNAVDVLEIDAATNRGIDEIRELRDAARYRPARDKYKIIILDEAHQITDAAFNALLKTLEEPPEHIVFMMATTEPENIPQTIRSRCQHYSFHAVKLEDILTQLRLIATAENISADESALALLAEAGDGSMRDALSIMDQAIASAPVVDEKPVLDASQIRDLMGSMPNTIFEQIMEAVSANSAADVLTIAGRLLDSGNSPAQIARQMVRYLRNCTVAKIANLTPDNAHSDLLQISQEESRRAARTAMLFSEEELTRFLQMMLRTFDDLGFRQEQRLHLELGLLKLVHLQRLIPMEELLSAFPTTGGNGGSGAPRSTTPRPASAAPPASTGAARTAPVASAPVSAPATPVSAPAQPAKTETPVASPFSPFAQKEPVADTPRVAPQSAAPIATTITNGSLAVAEAPAPAAPPQVGIIEDMAASIAPVADVISAPDEEALPPAEVGSEADQLRAAVVEALFATKNQTNAAEKLDDAEWTVVGGELRVQTDLSPAMLKMMIRPETDAIIKSTLRSKDAAGLKIVFLPVDKTKPAAEKKSNKPARTGSVQAMALEHPIVQEAQKLFRAEVTTVRDLRK